MAGVFAITQASWRKIVSAINRTHPDTRLLFLIKKRFVEQFGFTTYKKILL